MTVIERKKAIIDWIEGLDEDSTLSILEGIKNKETQSIPSDILHLLDVSSQTKREDMIPYTTLDTLLNSK